MIKVEHPDPQSVKYLQKLLYSVTGKHVCMYFFFYALIILLDRLVLSKWIESGWIEAVFVGVYLSIYSKVYGTGNWFFRLRLAGMMMFGIAIIVVLGTKGTLPIDRVIAFAGISLVFGIVCRYINKSTRDEFMKYIKDKKDLST